MNKIELYTKFLNRFMEDDKISQITLMDTNTFMEYKIAKVALDEDNSLYIEALDKSYVPRELYESLIRDYLVSRLLSTEANFYSFLEGETLYAISIDESGRFFIETYKRTLYVEDIEKVLDNH